MTLVLGDEACLKEVTPTAVKTFTEDAAVELALKLRGLLHDACSTLSLKTLQAAVDRDILTQSLLALQSLAERQDCPSDSRLPLLMTSLLTDFQILFSKSVATHDASIGHVPLLTYFLCERDKFGDDVQWRAAELVVLKAFTTAMLSVLRAEWLPVDARLLAITNLSSALLAYPVERSTADMMSAWFEDSALQALFQISFDKRVPATATVRTALNTSRAVVSMMTFGIGLNCLNNLAVCSLVGSMKRVVNGNMTVSKRCTCTLCEDSRVYCRKAAIGAFAASSKQCMRSRSRWAARLLSHNVVDFQRKLNSAVPSQEESATEVVRNDTALLSLLICHAVERCVDEHRDSMDDDAPLIHLEMCNLTKLIIELLRESRVQGTLLQSFSNMSLLSAILKLLLQLRGNPSAEYSHFSSALEVVSGCIKDILRMDAGELAAAPYAAPFMAAALFCHHVAEEQVRARRASATGSSAVCASDLYSTEEDCGLLIAVATAEIAKVECTKSQPTGIPNTTAMHVTAYCLFGLMAIVAKLPEKNSTSESKQWLLPPPPAYAAFIKTTGKSLVKHFASFDESCSLRRCTYFHSLAAELDLHCESVVYT